MVRKLWGKADARDRLKPQAQTPDPQTPLGLARLIEHTPQKYPPSAPTPARARKSNHQIPRADDQNPTLDAESLTQQPNSHPLPHHNNKDTMADRGASGGAPPARGGGFGSRGGDRGRGRGRGRGRRGGKSEEKEWQPVTKLGRLVKAGKINSMEEIYLHSLPIKEYQIVDNFLPKLKDEVMKVRTLKKEKKKKTLAIHFLQRHSYVVMATKVIFERKS